MKYRSSIVAIALLSSMSFAGGDIGGVTTFQMMIIKRQRELPKMKLSLKLPTVLMGGGRPMGDIL